MKIAIPLRRNPKASTVFKWYADVQQVWVFDIMAPIYVNGQLYGTFDIRYSDHEWAKQRMVLCFTGSLQWFSFLLSASLFYRFFLAN